MKLIINETYDIEDFDFHIEAKRESLKKFINDASQYFIDMGIVPTIEQVHDYITADRWARGHIYNGANCEIQDPVWECLSLNKLCNNIRNMCSFNMNDIDESLVTYEQPHDDISNVLYHKGDANCDGQVDLSDAVMIMQALANPNKYGIDGTAEHHLTEQGKLNGDMNGDGLTVSDALAIQEKLLGLN